jgi:hypothetical protein
MRRKTHGIALAGATVLVLPVAAACSSTSTPTPTASVAAANSTAANVSTITANYLDGITAPPGWTITRWAVGFAGAYWNPDSVEVDANHVWVGYQNTTAKDGTDTNKSTIVEYSLDGTVIKTWSVPGHNDGLRVDPSTHLVWASSNEDGNPRLNIIDPNSGSVTPYTFAPTVHGGGYDDMAFSNGVAYIACSNPTLNAAGANVAPAIDKVTLSGGTATVSPVLMGNAQATLLTSAGLALTPPQSTNLNLTDPDSMTFDLQGNLVLVSQADNAILQIQNLGTPQQKVLETQVGTELDDTIWTTSGSGRLFVADGGRNAIYTLQWKGSRGTVITQAPNDSGVISFVGTVNMTTGQVLPIVTGFVKPTGMVFVPGT